MSNFGEVLGMCVGEKEGKEIKLLLQFLAINTKEMRHLSWNCVWPIAQWVAGIPLYSLEDGSPLLAVCRCNKHSCNNLCYSSAFNLTQVCCRWALTQSLLKSNSLMKSWDLSCSLGPGTAQGPRDKGVLLKQWLITWLSTGTHQKQDLFY